MSEIFGKITYETLKRFEIDPAKSELARFIPEGGIEAQEFVRLPIEQTLQTIIENAEEDYYFTVNELQYNILVSDGVLPDSIAHTIALYAAREVLPIFEKTYPRNTCPRQAIETKEMWLKGEANDEILTAAGTDARFASQSARKGPARPAAMAAAGVTNTTARNIAHNVALDAARAAAESVTAGCWSEFYTGIFRRLCELIDEAATPPRSSLEI